MKTKVCTKCGIDKPVSEFNKAKGAKDNHNPWCINCAKDYSKEYRRIHTKQKTCRVRNDYKVYFKVCSQCGVLKSADKYYKNNYNESGLRAQCSECMDTYNAEQYRNGGGYCYDKEKMQTYYQTNKERINQKQKLWMKANRPAYLKSRKMYRENNKDKIQEYKKDVRENLKDPYIKEFLNTKYKIKSEYIPSEIIELQRTVLLIRREIKRRTA